MGSSLVFGSNNLLSPHSSESPGKSKTDALGMILTSCGICAQTSAIARSLLAINAATESFLQSNSGVMQKHDSPNFSLRSRSVSADSRGDVTRSPIMGKRLQFQSVNFLIISPHIQTYCSTFCAKMQDKYAFLSCYEQGVNSGGDIVQTFYTSFVDNAKKKQAK